MVLFKLVCSRERPGKASNKKPGAELIGAGLFKTYGLIGSE